MKHTPGSWHAGRDYYGGASVRTVPSEGTNIIGENAIFENTGRSSGDPTEEDVELLALAPTAPHDCEVPECPGRRNKARLEAFAELIPVLEYVAIQCPCGARPESPHTHPHVVHCPVEHALRIAKETTP